MVIWFVVSCGLPILDVSSTSSLNVQTGSQMLDIVETKSMEPSAVNSASSHPDYSKPGHHQPGHHLPEPPPSPSPQQSLKDLPLVTLAPTWMEMPAVRKNRKSIVMISLDTVQAKRLSLYGGRAKVPVLSKFAEKSTLFEQAISHFPQTPHSHWSIMSGVLPEVHGDIPLNRGSIYSGPTIAEIAKRNGYSTGAFISGYSLTKAVSGLHRGFDSYDEDYPFHKEDNRYGADVTKRAVKWMQEASSSAEPFFLFVHYFDAHQPYAPQENLYDPQYTGSIDGTDDTILVYREGHATPSPRDVEHVKALYDAEITELDAMLEDLFNAIPKDTVVVVFADHGESFGHNYYFNHQDGLWDELLHVPLIIYTPDSKGGKRVPDLVGLFDIAPTILDLAGLPKDQRMQGQSLIGLIDPQLWTAKSSMPKLEANRRIYSITNQWNPMRQFAVRSNEWKVIQSSRGVERYQIQTDPMELQLVRHGGMDVQAERQRYNEMIVSLRSSVSQAVNQHPLEHHECQQLQKLGYTTCSVQK